MKQGKTSEKVVLPKEKKGTKKQNTATKKEIKKEKVSEKEIIVTPTQKEQPIKKGLHHINWKWTAIILAILLACDIVFTTQELRFQLEDVENLMVRKEMISDNVIFLGDSITEQYPLEEFYDQIHVVNSGISGHQSGDILRDMHNRVYRYNPSKVFLMIGTNDMAQGKSDQVIYKNIEKIITEIQEHRPHAKLYVESIYPINEAKYEDHDGDLNNKTNKRIINVNNKIKELCKKYDVTYVDVFSKLLDTEKQLKNSYTTDGLHLTPLGYLKVTNILMPYITE